MSKAATTNNSLSVVARQQAQQGLKVERDFVEPNLDQPTATRTNPVQCWNCNKITYVSFVPDGERPVYCKDCLRDIKAQRAADNVKSAVTNKNEPMAPPIRRSEELTPSRSSLNLPPIAKMISVNKEQVSIPRPLVARDANNFVNKDLKPISRPAYSVTNSVEQSKVAKPKINSPVISKPAIAVLPDKKEVARVESAQEQEDETVEKQDIGLSLDTALKMRPVSFSGAKTSAPRKPTSSTGKILKPGQKISFSN